MTRLPVPEWGRGDETWRVEPEPEWTTDAEFYICSVGRCRRDAIARRPRNEYTLCAFHAEGIGMWIEDGRVVSWALRP